MAIFLTTVVVILVSGNILQRTYHKQALQNKISQVQSQCNILASQIQLNEFNINSNTNNLDIEIDQLANVLEGRLIVVNADYRIIKDTYTIEQNKYMISNDVHNIMQGKNSSNCEIKEGNQYAEIMVPILDSSAVTTTIENSTVTTKSGDSAQNATKQALGVIICMVSIRDLTETDAYMEVQGRILYALFIFVALLLSLLLAYLLPRPLKKLNRQLVRVSEGHLDEQIELEGGTEITDLKETFNRILRKIQLLESSRQEFVSNVSHELKTPITSMKVLADSLVAQAEQGEVPNELYREFMTDIAEEIDRENKIITDLLSLVKMDKKSSDINIKETNINDLIELILKRLRPIAAKNNINLVLESFKPIIAQVDETKLTLALSNLVENGIKYNRENGWVHVSLNVDNNFFYVKVEDSGIGIPEADQEHIFERFYRVDKSHSREIGGTGLGLAITRSAVLMHHGAVRVYSKEGEGTTFTVRIPLHYVP